MTLPTDLRMTELSAWLSEQLPSLDRPLAPASGDASFRRYFRIAVDGHSWIVMDAPPATENLRSFVDVARLLSGAGINVPEIRAADLDRGFTLLSDLGDIRYQDALGEHSADRLYRDAIATLIRFQSAISWRDCNRPAYDAALLRREVELFREWYLHGLLGLHLEATAERLLDTTWTLLIESALEQPKVFVHRDYHSRNLMVHPSANPGVLDFQDAVVGPISYDLVSLLKDCYIEWPDERVRVWMNHYLDLSRTYGLLDDRSMLRFPRWFDLMGMQRHLKAIGIFSRLKLRDGKTGYLADIPRTLGYVLRVCDAHADFKDFGKFLRLATRSAAEPAIHA